MRKKKLHQQIPGKFLHLKKKTRIDWCPLHPADTIEDGVSLFNNTADLVQCSHATSQFTFSSLAVLQTSLVLFCMLFFLTAMFASWLAALLPCDLRNPSQTEIL